VNVSKTMYGCIILYDFIMGMGLLY